MANTPHAKALSVSTEPGQSQGDAADIAARLLTLAERVDLSRIATSPRGPKRKVDRSYVAPAAARTHMATARVLNKAKLKANKAP